jgi:hypothetical protein
MLLISLHNNGAKNGLMDTFIEFHSVEYCLLENEKLHNLGLSYTFINKELTLELCESVQKKNQ